jgi:hypothetical protein
MEGRCNLEHLSAHEGWERRVGRRVEGKANSPGYLFLSSGGVCDRVQAQIERLRFFFDCVRREWRRRLDDSDGPRADDGSLERIRRSGRIIEQRGLRVGRRMNSGTEETCRDAGQANRRKRYANCFVSSEVSGGAAEQKNEKRKRRRFEEQIRKQDAKGKETGRKECRASPEGQGLSEIRLAPRSHGRAANRWGRLRRRDGCGGHKFANPWATGLSAREHGDAFQVECLRKEVHHRDCLEVVAGVYQRGEVARQGCRVARDINDLFWPNLGK